MKLGIYINKNKKNLINILNIIHDEFPLKDHQFIYLNEEKFISKLNIIKRDKITKASKEMLSIYLKIQSTIENNSK